MSTHPIIRYRTGRRRRHFCHALSNCIAPYVDIILHRGRFWAKSAASGSVRWCCFRSCWTVLSNVMRGRPSCTGPGHVNTSYVYNIFSALQEHFCRLIHYTHALCCCLYTILDLALNVLMDRGPRSKPHLSNNAVLIITDIQPWCRLCIYTAINSHRYRGHRQTLSSVWGINAPTKLTEIIQLDERFERRPTPVSTQRS